MYSDVRRVLASIVWESKGGLQGIVDELVRNDAGVVARLLPIVAVVMIVIMHCLV